MRVHGIHGLSVVIGHLLHFSILGQIQWMELKLILGVGKGWGRSGKGAPSGPVMMNAIMETSCGVPFIYLVEQIFPFPLSRSICIAQMSGKYHECERKKDQRFIRPGIIFNHLSLN